MEESPKSLYRQSSNFLLIPELHVHGMRHEGTQEENNSWRAERTEQKYQQLPVTGETKFGSNSTKLGGLGNHIRLSTQTSRGLCLRREEYIQKLRDLP